MSADAIQHEFEVGDKVHKYATGYWKITNRMVDVDTDEVLYRLRGVDKKSGNKGDTRIATESSLKAGFVESES